MTPDERAEAALPCKAAPKFAACKYPNYRGDSYHHSNCPAFYRSAVAAQIREAVEKEQKRLTLLDLECESVESILRRYGVYNPSVYHDLMRTFEDWRAGCIKARLADVAAAEQRGRKAAEAKP